MLVYSTCTIEPEENEERVERFIKENGDFYLEDLSGLIPQTLKKEGLNKGYLQLYPNIDGVDGFFIARMIRGVSLMEDKLDLLSMTIDELEDLVLKMGHKKFHGKQIFQWTNKGIKDIDEMSNLSKELRNRLKERTYINRLEIVKKLASSIDDTTKYLFRLMDGSVIESVLMKYQHGYSACISSQVGCRMGCRFVPQPVPGL